MKLIVGLGNVGANYAFTRHNVGFMVVDKFALDAGVQFKENSKLRAYVASIKGVEDYLLVKPTTYMNLSGEAIQLVMNYYKISIEDLLVVYDDLSLDLGKLRYRPNGSDGGHNGIKSIIKNLSTKDFARLKVGIGPQPNIPSEAFVLQKFSDNELKELKSVLDKSVESIQYYFKNGIAKTQIIYN
jgi:PTH1 family peptidyl-tRNA hydrolase